MKENYQAKKTYGLRATSNLEKMYPSARRIKFPDSLDRIRTRRESGRGQPILKDVDGSFHLVTL